ncbi:MAG: hypothetical protein O3C40_06240 [Planctomycetota bacterium]|nr:hypothetical protein [Planctomycetota bacterium]
MRNWVAAFPLVLLVPLGLLLATSGLRNVIPTPLPLESGETSPSGGLPSVQDVATASGSDVDPLISPIIVSELADVRSISMKPDFTHGNRAIFHPHGEQVCASGCAASRHPTDTLTQDRFNGLLLEYADEPIDDAGPAQDALMYYGRQAVQLLATEGPGRLDPVRAAVLKHELGRDHAEIEIRVVDALDRVRASLPPTNVPLDRRHEFELDTHQLQPMIASGTVKRVGRDYLWTRL